MPAKPGLTRRQHVELGEQLQVARETLINAATMLSNAYPKKHRVCGQARRAQNAVDLLRSLLDDLSANELPSQLWSPTIYYGANRVTRAEWLAANPLEDET